MTKITIVAATTNQGKIAEIHSILHTLKGVDFDVHSLADYTINEPDEPYETFLENAIHKAKYYGDHTNKWTLSDDSGLCINALDGFPGVRTKEFAEECGGVANALLSLENRLSGAPNYDAYFHCAAVLYMPEHNVVISHETQFHGRLSFPPQGLDGFGFDPIFIPTGYNTSVAALGPHIKNAISHRSKALRGLSKKLEDFLKTRD